MDRNRFQTRITLASPYRRAVEGEDCTLIASTTGLQMTNFWRRLVAPKRIDAWSLPSLQQRLVQLGARLVKHSRYYSLLLAERHLTRLLFGMRLQRIWALSVPDRLTCGGRYGARVVKTGRNRGEVSETCRRTTSLPARATAMRTPLTVSGA